MTKTWIKDFGKKIIIGVCVLALSGFSMILKPANAYADILSGANDANGGHMHNCKPDVRAKINVSDLKGPNQNFKGNVDKTKYKDNKTHYVYNTYLEIKDYERHGDNKGKFFHVTHDNQSGWFWLDANDFHYYITVEGADNSIKAKFTVASTDCVDTGSQDLVLDYEMAKDDVSDDWFRVDMGDKDILRKIVNNPSEYEGYEVYVSRVWIED